MQWNERARPVSLKHIVGQRNFISDAESWQSNDEWPSSLLLVGPPGVGKTTSARVIARAVLGEFYDPVNYLETNASDERGIDSIRGELKTFAGTRPLGADRRVALLDEADGLTPAAQDAMRQVIENHSDNCLFILTANQADKIRPAIKSRCSVYEFKPLTPEEGAMHLTNVCVAVNLDFNIIEAWKPLFPRLVYIHNGDLRACVNTLQSLKHDEDALKEKCKEIDVVSDAAASALVDNWLEMRVSLHNALDRGSTRMMVMQSFYQNISSFFEIGEDTNRLWDILAVYSDMMSRIHEWPDNSYSYVDCFIAKLKKELNN
jgi:replication factor C small subunit|tara:strand:- start:2472 stop:3425 length:954 start_codon:yes stop_codon:yes gene_type:complete